MLSEVINGAKEQLAGPPTPMRSMPQTAMFDVIINKVQSISKLCYPEKPPNFRTQASPEQIDSKVPDEPNLPDADKMHQYRRFYYLSTNAKNAMAELRNQLIGEIERAKEVIGQEATRK